MEARRKKISKATKVLWIAVLGYICFAFLLITINVDSALPELMAEGFGAVFFGALAIQFVIYIINKFTSGYKGE